MLTPFSGKFSQAGILAAGTILLVWPALVNGWPLVFHDTGGYLDRGFLLTLGFGRSLYYGLFLRVFAWPELALWPAVFAQSAIGAWVIILGLRVTGAGNAATLGILALIGLGTGYGFFTAQLMPDAFSGPMVFAVYLLAYHRDGIGRGARIGLGVLVTFACLAHMSHLALGLGLIASLAVLRAAKLGPPVAVPWLPLAAAVIILPLGNGLASGTFGTTPGSNVFVLGRFVQDGLAQQVLDELCPDPRFKLCAFRDKLPRNANDFLWGGEDAALRQVGGLDGADAEARALIIESLIRHPVENIKSAVKAAVDQFFLFRTADELGAWMWHTPWRVEAFFPEQMPAYNAALQHREVKPDLGRLDAVHTLVIWIAAGLLAISAGRSSGAGRALAGFVLLALMGNAAICGILSNPQPRYQDRVIWLVPLAAAIAVQRRRVTG